MASNPQLPQNAAEITISLCICTMNRPDDLRRCLRSVVDAETPPEQIIVSDDSRDGASSRDVAREFHDVIYQPGPKRGLGPNRNACIRRAEGGFIVFVDDDVCVPPGFFHTARRLLASQESNMVLTGYEIRHDADGAHKIVPHNIDFWGLQRVPVRGQYRAVVINSTVFPHALFAQAQFDEHLRYGGEEIDMAQHAVALGCAIHYTDEIYVDHYPSPVNRDTYDNFIHASRLYGTAKAYRLYEKRPWKAAAFAVLAPLQLLGSALKSRRPGAVRQAARAIRLACRYFWNARAHPPDVTR